MVHRRFFFKVIDCIIFNFQKTEQHTLWSKIWHIVAQLALCVLFGLGLVELFYGDGVAGKIKGIVKLIKAG